METCRICLARPKRLQSIFEVAEITTGSKMYSEIIALLANVKVYKGDGFPETICRSCRKKVLEAYELKILIERTHNSFESNRKRLNFNNINEIKIEIDLLKVDNDENKPDNITIPDGFNMSDSVVYNDTTIQKVKIEKEPIHILDFLGHIKEEHNFENTESYFSDGMSQFGSDKSDKYDIPLIKRMKKKKGKKKKKRSHESDNEHSPGLLDADDEEYLPGWDCRKKDKKKAGTIDPSKTKKKLGRKPKRTLKQVLIKPVFLREIGTVPSTPKAREHNKKDTDKLQLCPHCGKQTKSLKAHILIHIGERKFKCDHCPKSYLSKNYLKYHMVQHGGPKNHKCDQCIAAFYTASSLRTHKLVHSTERKFICDICSKAFKRRTAMMRHLLAHNSANKSIKCELCNMSFFAQGNLRHHMRIHTGERPYKCELCSQPYSYKHDFNRHCLNKHGIFLKRRKVYVMNEEVLHREREMMKEVVRRAQGILKEGEPINPFESEGAASYLAFMQAVKALQNNQIKIPIDISY